MKIGIIGCGNMGQALLGAIIAKNYTSKKNILVSDKDRDKIHAARLRYKVNIASSNSELFKKCDLIILAIKPQNLGVVVQNVLTSLKKKLVISICAGITTKRLESCFGKVAVVRVMPNMPAQISQGVSAISLGKYAREKDKKVAISIFSCVGEVVEVKEQLLDAVTAISGSGPAYFFYLVENLIYTAVELGIPHSIAQRLAIKTALGSAMLMNQSKENPQALRKQVTSKGGTTEAAFNIFKSEALDRLLRRAFRAAAKKSRELRK